VPRTYKQFAVTIFNLGRNLLSGNSKRSGRSHIRSLAAAYRMVFHPLLSVSPDGKS